MRRLALQEFGIIGLQSGENVKYAEVTTTKGMADAPVDSMHFSRSP